MICSFFFNDTATTEIYTLSLHDALPILRTFRPSRVAPTNRRAGWSCRSPPGRRLASGGTPRSGRAPRADVGGPPGSGASWGAQLGRYERLGQDGCSDSSLLEHNLTPKRVRVKVHFLTLSSRRGGSPSVRRASRNVAANRRWGRGLCAGVGENFEQKWISTPPLHPLEDATPSGLPVCYRQQ